MDSIIHEGKQWQFVENIFFLVHSCVTYIDKVTMGNSLAVELSALDRATLVRIQVPQPIGRALWFIAYHSLLLFWSIPFCLGLVHQRTRPSVHPIAKVFQVPAVLVSLLVFLLASFLFC